VPARVAASFAGMGARKGRRALPLALLLSAHIWGGGGQAEAVAGRPKLQEKQALQHNAGPQAVLPDQHLPYTLPYRRRSAPPVRQAVLDDQHLRLGRHQRVGAHRVRPGHAPEAVGRPSLQAGGGPLHHGHDCARAEQASPQECRAQARRLSARRAC